MDIPSYRFIVGGGIGLGMSSIIAEDISNFNPEGFGEISLGYRLSSNFLVSTGLLMMSDHSIPFERDGTVSFFSGTTTIIPLVFDFTKDKEGVSPVFGIGIYYRTDQMFSGESEYIIGNDLSTGQMVSNIGSHLKLGLSYTNYSDYSNLSFLKGAQYDITFNSYADGFDKEFKIASSVIMFRVAALF